MHQVRKILVTGANGYLGSHLSYRLIEQGYDVVLSDIGDVSILKHKSYIQHDFSESKSIEHLLKEVDLVFLR